MKYLLQLKPGKRENAFYIKSPLSRIDRFGMQSNENTSYFVYEWDETQNKHVKKWIEKN